MDGIEDMERRKEAARRMRVGRILAIVVCVGLGIIGDAAIQVVLISPMIDRSPVEAAASDLIATAHDWADAADRRRAALEDAQSARQSRIDRAAQDLLDHD